VAISPLRLHWFLPTYGDSRDLIAGGHGSSMRGDRPADLRYLTQLAQAAEINGFEAVLTPTGLWCEDAWLSTAMLIQSTEKLKYLVAFRPGLVSPTLAAQMATTFQWQSQGRLMLNVVTGGESSEQQAFGDFLPKEARYARCGEFLDIVRRLWTSQEPVTADGEHLRVEQAVLARHPDPLPPVFFGGSSPAAGEVAARYADTYLTWGERPEQVKEKLDWIRGLAAAQGRQLSYGIRLHVISRDTSEQAWSEAQRLLSGLSPETVAAAQQSLARSESVGQRRMRQLHGGGDDFAAGADARQLEIYPNLWSGVGLVRGGAGTALVGSHDEVADRIAEYAELGLDHFILSGYPHLEEAYIFGEGVRPRLSKRGLLGDDAAADRLGEPVRSAFLPRVGDASAS
jgi:alkanesulfonate monooxygenase